jgi:uncharacterized protein (TIGR02594 family)
MSTPPWMAWARDQLGTRETPGPANSPKIMGWAAKVKKWLGIDYTADATPWCGLFVTAAVQHAGYTPPRIAIRAKSWALWGEELKAACFGAVAVFERPGGGHVGFVEAESPTAYLILGGNQGDSVSKAWIAKDRCIALRWPYGYPKTKRVLVASNGQPLSTNEA